jgi:flagellar biosynthetic protein FliP
VTTAVLPSSAAARPTLTTRTAGPASPAHPLVSRAFAVAAAVLLAVVVLLLGVTSAHAGELDPTIPAPVQPSAPADPTAPVPPGSDDGLSIEINGVNGEPSSAVLTLIGITLLSVAPALLLMMTSFTKIFVVLAMTRNALSLPSIPPNQVLAGLALFLSLFIMAPVLTQINDLGVQPYLEGATTFTQALEDGAAPLQTFMLAHTREEDLALMTRAAGQPNPEDAAGVPLTTLIPAFMISELRAAFIIGFVIFVPFLVIDLVVSAALMSMGMMMLPPVMISLPFKILLFVLVDGWGLIITALINSYQGG